MIQRVSEKQEDTLTVLGDAMLRELAPVFDRPLGISIEVGRLRLRMRELMELSPGAVIELNKRTGEPFDICVNGAPVARGEIITAEQSPGVRIIEVRKPRGLSS